MTTYAIQPQGQHLDSRGVLVRGVGAKAANRGFAHTRELTRP